MAEVGPFQQLFSRTLGLGLRRQRTETDALIKQVQSDAADKAFPGALQGLINYGEQPMTAQQHEQFRAALQQGVATLHEYAAANQVFKSNLAAVRKNATPTENKMLDQAERARQLAQSQATTGDMPTALKTLAAATSVPQSILNQRYKDNAPVRQFQAQLAAAHMTPDEANRAWEAKLNIGDRKRAEAMADGMYEHRIPWPSGTMTKDPTVQLAMGLVLERHPDFQANLYEVQTKTREAFIYGKQGDRLRSVEVSTGHMEMLRSAAAALQNGQSTLANAWMQEYNRQTGKSAPTTFDAIKTLVGDEVAAALVKGPGALEDRKSIQEHIAAARSQPQLAKALDAFEHLMWQQKEGLKHQYEWSGLTDWSGGDGLPPKLDPNVEKILDNFSPEAIAKRAQDQANQDTPGSVHGTIDRSGAKIGPHLPVRHTNRATNENNPEDANTGEKALGAVIATGKTLGKGLSWLAHLVIPGAGE